MFNDKASDVGTFPHDASAHLHRAHRCYPEEPPYKAWNN
ncbi:hypothetical protein ACCUM_2756 [Candidatus Accumulibacter phosphatis]|uniref:Uncharacterized protein n=1 Tax=Candidatus Accumulibacter phosphatis TaxID=327160 RepID=A0A5S4EHS2_9PROT|nr:hypothetical protein ACCUM_2756 [Candidatus Accumulibacter phosphatis]